MPHLVACATRPRRVNEIKRRVEKIRLKTVCKKRKLIRFFFFLLLNFFLSVGDVRAHTKRLENTGNSLTSSVFSRAELLNGLGQFQTIINSVHKTPYGFKHKGQNYIRRFCPDGQCAFFFSKFPPPLGRLYSRFFFMKFLVFFFFKHILSFAQNTSSRVPRSLRRATAPPSHQRTEKNGKTSKARCSVKIATPL